MSIHVLDEKWFHTLYNSAKTALIIVLSSAKPCIPGGATYFVCLFSNNNMPLRSASTDTLLQLADVVGQLTPTQYTRPLPILSGNSLGKHVRHVLECYDLLLLSVQTGYLSYDHRQRELSLETDPQEALRRISALEQAIQTLDLTQPLRLETTVSAQATQPVILGSSVARELLHNIEHTTHHMALIQVALRSAFASVVLPPNFGVAAATIKHAASAAG
jgi:uncharacterized damage-inducible protein DinB